MVNEKVFNEMALMVTRQTELSIDEAKDKLKENNYNYMQVIKEELGIKKKESNDSGTINQKIYKEIRTLMDDGAKKYRMKQEMQKKREEYIKKLQENLKEQEEKKKIKTIVEVDEEKEIQENN